jgi:hypothetical protein
LLYNPTLILRKILLRVMSGLYFGGAGMEKGKCRMMKSTSEKSKGRPKSKGLARGGKLGQ